MELTERQKQILRAVVEGYIATAEPVGSKAIAQMPGMNFSSATIRNELAHLTELGLLEQPHTSAGRIPSVAGYRLYIDTLMQDYRLSQDENRALNQQMEGKVREFSQAVEEAGRLVSKLTNLPAYAVAAPTKAATASRFEIIQSAAHSFILVVLTSSEQVHNKLIKLPVDVDPQDLKSLTAVLNAALTDLTADEITPRVLEKLQRSAGSAASLVSVIVEYTISALREEQEKEVYVTGQSRILDQPEYQDVHKAQELMRHLDEQTISSLVVPDGDSSSNVRILVGPENVAKEFQDTSVVMASYDLGDGTKGMLGVVGPTRMDYAQIAAHLQYFAEGLGKYFAKGLPPELRAPEATKTLPAGAGSEPDKAREESDE